MTNAEALEILKNLVVDYGNMNDDEVAELDLAIDCAFVALGTDIVRCKDCKWSDWYTTVEGKHFCYCLETGNGGRTENDYCSYGERGENE